ncbi:MAG: ComF family protein [Chitinophagaceae bacterium]|nr:ComF family protein [Chitinophagaceae bacterium]
MISVAKSLLQLIYPHYCMGCGSDYLSLHQQICSRCTHLLPETGFFRQPNNPVEKAFFGRIRVENAAALYYFTKQSLIQELMVQLKYHQNKHAGLFLGRMMGYALRSEPRIADVDLLLQLPLNPKKQFKRGYNQAEVICEGISDVWPKPMNSKAIQREKFTDSQTTQSRLSRWTNMEGVFKVMHPDQLINKHVLLVDDVITTGATLEACGQTLMPIPDCRLSIAASAYTL